MKLICLTFAILSVALVYGESCNSNSCDGDAIHTHCTGGWVVECHTSIIGNECTCVDPDATTTTGCSSNADCAGHHCHGNLHPRCIQFIGSGHCSCGFGGGK